MVPGHEQCFARLSPDGVLELRIGAHSHGQSLETTLAQVANEILGIDPANVRLIHGDTALTPYSTGTWGSRCMVMSGGAVAAASKEIGRRVKQIAGKLLEVAVADLVLEDGKVKVAGTDKSMTLAEVAHVWYRAPQLLPADVDPGGLEATAGYKAKVDTGTFSYACHAVAVAVDTGTGQTEILDYVIAEDGGTLVNPMVVDGQICGGTAQGIGTALYEEMPYDKDGQPLASTLADYLLPGPTEVPSIAHPAHGNAFALYRVRPERHRRRRRHRAARGDRQRDQRCAQGAGRGNHGEPGEPAQGARRNPRSGGQAGRVTFARRASRPRSASARQHRLEKADVRCDHSPSRRRVQPGLHLPAEAP